MENFLIKTLRLSTNTNMGHISTWGSFTVSRKAAKLAKTYQITRRDLEELRTAKNLSNKGPFVFRGL